MKAKKKGEKMYLICNNWTMKPFVFCILLYVKMVPLVKVKSMLILINDSKNIKIC